MILSLSLDFILFFSAFNILPCVTSNASLFDFFSLSFAVILISFWKSSFLHQLWSSEQFKGIMNLSGCNQRLHTISHTWVGKTWKRERWLRVIYFPESSSSRGHEILPFEECNEKSHEFSFEMFEKKNVCGFALCCGIRRTWRLSEFQKIIRLW